MKSLEYLTTKKLSERTGLSPSTLRRLKKQGRIPFFQPGGPGTAVRFPANALEETTPAPVSALPKRALSGPKPKWAS